MGKVDQIRVDRIFSEVLAVQGTNPGILEKESLSGMDFFSVSSGQYPFQEGCISKRR